MSKKFIQRCEAVGLKEGSLFTWLEKVETLQVENAALKEQVAQLERAPEIESDEYKTWWGLALHVGAWKDHELDYVHFGSEMAVRAFAIHLLRQRDKFEAEQQQTITALQSKAAALVDALEGLLSLDEENHQRYPGDEDVCLEVRNARAALAEFKGAKR